MPSMPCWSNWAFTSGSASAAATAAWMRLTISGGAPAGSQRPNQLTFSKPLRPCSSMVGTSGMPFQRFLPVSARARRRPLCTCCRAMLVPTKNMSIRPAIRSVIASGMALYGTERMSVPVMDFISSAGMWLAVPLPALA
jgi:hypothetical protein